NVLAADSLNPPPADASCAVTPTILCISWGMVEVLTPNLTASDINLITDWSVLEDSMPVPESWPITCWALPSLAFLWNCRADPVNERAPSEVAPAPIRDWEL